MRVYVQRDEALLDGLEVHDVPDHPSAFVDVIHDLGHLGQGQLEVLVVFMALGCVLQRLLEEAERRVCGLRP